MLAITMMALLLMFVGISVNIGQAVNRRVAAQLIADAGAFTGATNMAIGANGVAYWNGLIQDAWSALTWATGGFILAPDCVINDKAVSAYHKFRSGIGRVLQVVNLGYARVAWDEARRVSKYNEYDLFPGEIGTLDYREEDTSGAVKIRAGRNRMPIPPNMGVFTLAQVSSGARPTSEIPALRGALRSAAWVCYCKACPPLLQFQPRFANFDVWYKKADPSPAFFSFIVKLPKAETLLFDRFLGGQAMPEMRAAAAAKPVGGSIEKREGKYVAKMMPVRNVMKSPFDVGSLLGGLAAGLTGRLGPAGGLLSSFLPTSGAPTVSSQNGNGGTASKKVLH